MKAKRLLVFGLVATMFVPVAAGSAEAQGAGSALGEDRLIADGVRNSAQERAAARRAEAAARRAAVYERHRARRAALEAKSAGVLGVGVGTEGVPMSGAGAGEPALRVVALREGWDGGTIVDADDAVFGLSGLDPRIPAMFPLDRFGGSVSCQLFMLPWRRGFDPFLAPFGHGGFGVSGVCVPTAPWLDPFGGFGPFDPFGFWPFLDGPWRDPWDFRDRPKHRRDRFDRHW